MLGQKFGCFGQFKSRYVSAEQDTIVPHTRGTESLKSPQGTLTGDGQGTRSPCLKNAVVVSVSSRKLWNLTAIESLGSFGPTMILFFSRPTNDQTEAQAWRNTRTEDGCGIYRLTS